MPRSPLGMNFRAFQRAFFDDRKVLRRFDRGAERGMKRVGRILVNAAKSEIKYAAPTARQWERLKDPDPAKRKRAAAAIARAKAKRSRPGGPPLARSRSRSRTLRNILYAWSYTRRSITYGPVRFSSKASNVVPETLEYGGAAEVFEVEINQRTAEQGRDASGRYTTVRRRIKKRWVPVGRKGYRRSPRKQRRRRSVSVGRRPFMSTSFADKQDTIRPILAAAWSGTG